MTSSSRAQPHQADWLHDAKLGTFMHFLPSGPNAMKQVTDFDVKAVSNQLRDMGAGYLVFTLGQNSGYFNAPNSTYDRLTGYAPGERCAKRDLPRDLTSALARRNIKLMLYLPCQVPNQDARAQKAFGLAEGPKDQPLSADFARKWAEVIREWSDRYRQQVAGWWFDGGYQHVGFNEEIASIYAEAAKHGNPRSIVTFNPGVKLVRWTRAEDYTAGELNDPLAVLPEKRWVDGSQWHALTYLGDAWGKRNTRFSNEQLSKWVRQVAAKGGVVTFDMGPNYDPSAGPVGAFSDVQVKQFTAVRQLLASE